MRALLFSALTAASLACYASAEETKSYDYEGFTKLKTSAGITVSYKPAPDYSVIATITKGTPENLKIRQYGSTLSISQKSTGWNKSSSIHVHVTSPELTGIDASSGSSIDVSGITAEAFSIESSSGSNIEVSGACTNLEAETSSGSSVDARELKCLRAEVEASSGSSIRVHATDYAESDPSSGASIRIYGDPKERDVEKSWSGGSTRFD
ncbi:MAG: GIN domain-containing protein [Hyphomonas sp.]